MDHGGAGNEKVGHADVAHATLAQVLCGGNGLFRYAVIKGMDDERVQEVRQYLR